MDRRDELARFLRARRDSLRPEDVGLPADRRRRTPGLRREEVAMLAGVSVTWYTWLEQGRRINASADVLTALARGLHLDAAGRQHLLTLADRSGAVDAGGAEPADEAPDALVRLIASMEPSPAYVLGPTWQFVAWNRAESRLYPTLEHLDHDHRNLLWVTFADPAVRALVVDWEDHARRTLAEFRAGTARLGQHPQVTSLVGALTTASAEFAEWWPAQDVAHFQTRLRRYRHPWAGDLVFEYQQLTPSEWPGLRVVCQLGVPGDNSAERLRAWRPIA
ncbi:MAG: helix-turn-helix transcriptional regulator [Ilumatobacteraceae bacterium]|jgi:transcriptional regulator with XRE-family HTH domain